MDFFAAQDRARRASRWLLFWFALAVAAIVAIVHLALGFGLALAADAPAASNVWSLELYFAVSLVVGGTILVGSFWKSAVLAAGGGAAVAESLGGRLVPRSTADAAERRLINVVEEMAIAAGLPAPPVYVLDEPGINAFAAGTQPQQAVVAVTAGALTHLSRDELQGVIGHEFSHILNGDMRLNLRLIGVLHGILMLAMGGRLLLRAAGRSDKGAAPVFLVGLALVATGYLGVLIGRLIRAAVSRQREFLADAAAVQFTRNPDGIAGALRKIGEAGAEISHPRGEEVSHMLFGPGAGLGRWLATHPPLAERIRRIEGGVRLAPVAVGADAFARDNTSMGAGVDGGMDAVAAGFSPAAHAGTAPSAAIAARVGAPGPAEVAAARAVVATLSAALRERLATPDGARAGVLALLLARDPGQRERQVAALRAVLGAETTGLLAVIAAEDMAGLPPALRLPLLEIALGALRELPRGGRERLLAAADALVRADGRVTLTEYVLTRILADALLPRAPQPLLASPGELRADCRLLLSLVAHGGQQGDDAVAAAYGRGAYRAPVDVDASPLAAAELKVAALDAAFARLAAAAPGFRRTLVEALAEVARHDGRIVPAEAELLRAVCGALDCPLPLAAEGVATLSAAADATTGAVPPGLTFGAANAQARGAKAGAATVTAAIDDDAPEPGWRWADRLPLQALILANLVPLGGVLFFGWDVRNLLLLYWLENLVVGFYTVLRMFRAGGIVAFGLCVFFVIHYGFFTGIHGLFVMSFGSVGRPEPSWQAAESAAWHALPFLMPLNMILVLVGWIAQHQPGLLGLPLLAFFVSHGISTWAHHFVGDEDAGRNAGQIMNDPYKRIVALHIAIIAGGFLVISSGGGGLAPVLMVLVAMKIGIDVVLHRSVHRRRHAARAGFRHAPRQRASLPWGVS